MLYQHGGRARPAKRTDLKHNTVLAGQIRSQRPACGDRLCDSERSQRSIEMAMTSAINVPFSLTMPNEKDLLHKHNNDTSVVPPIRLTNAVRAISDRVEFGAAPAFAQ